MFKYKYILFYKNGYYILKRKYSKMVVISTCSFSFMIKKCAEEFIDPELVQFKSISLSELFRDFVSF